MNLTIQNVAYHRNGVCGVPFTVILFTDNDIGGGTMVATISDADDMACHVLNVDELTKGNIGFAQGNSWRGDRYANVLLPLVKEFEKRN
jgi:hypothetical protein